MTMATIKSHSDIKQSKELAKILPIESADSHYVRKSTDFRGNPVDGKWSEPKYGNINSKYAHYVVQNFSSYEKLPCWSLAALLNVLPIDKLEKEFDDKWRFSIYLPSGQHKSHKCENPIDACMEMIVKLSELKLL